ncbi:TerB family tellurite resistance protein [Lignipirellula cremea]|uniref:Tellurite resistance protein TerB n=1 Tax=Lignipirellula cremea TaxID=2528010 RepID=A0A518DXV2_9BACT|nr:TerB family tellurite resistance protein [Lignipirellula cremea]QDU96670.1 Tellurite resistance protein TerB [Lignipirellula cremea]
MLAFIIYGTRGMTSIKSAGSFYCPDCAGDRSYLHKQVRVWFTLYFIPLIPMHTAGEYIECDHCKTGYTPEVLSYDPVEAEQEFQERFYESLVRVMTLLCMADGGVNPVDRQVIRGMMQQIAGDPYDAMLEASEERLVSATPADFVSYLERMTPHLKQEEKATVVQVIWETANSGPLTPRREQMLQKVPEALELSTEDFQEIVSRIG